MTDASGGERTDVDVTARVTQSSLHLAFPDSTWHVEFPDDWQPAPADEGDLWCWEAEMGARARVRLRLRPHVQLEVDVTSLADDVVLAHPPRIRIDSRGVTVPWFAGAAGELLVVRNADSALWVQMRGLCAPSGRGLSVLSEPLVLRPGQGSSAAWRRHALVADLLPPEPAWLPPQRYLPRGEPLEVVHSDAALMGIGLEITTTPEGSRVAGAPGLHELAFLDARGTTLVEVGWYAPLQDLASRCVALPNVDANLNAWLLATGVGDDPERLDLALATALEAPTFWGVLAGMRIQTLTDLPVAADVREAARSVWSCERDPDVRRLLVTHALLSGWEPDVVQGWLPDVAQTTAPPAGEVLASIGCGRITSSPLGHGGRDVASARTWVAAQGESMVVAEWERAVDAARARLLCSLSEAPRAEDVGWLVAEALLG